MADLAKEWLKHHNRRRPGNNDVGRARRPRPLGCGALPARDHHQNLVRARSNVAKDAGGAGLGYVATGSGIAEVGNNLASAVRAGEPDLGVTRRSVLQLIKHARHTVGSGVTCRNAELHGLAPPPTRALGARGRRQGGEEDRAERRSS